MFETWIIESESSGNYHHKKSFDDRKRLTGKAATTIPQLLELFSKRHVLILALYVLLSSLRLFNASNTKRSMYLVVTFCMLEYPNMECNHEELKFSMSIARCNRKTTYMVEWVYLRTPMLFSWNLAEV
jgi:hypothetical protein